MNGVDPIYAELTARLGLQDSRYMPLLLARLVNLEQAQIIRELPASTEEISAKLSLDTKSVERHIRELFEKGVIFYTKKGPQMARSFMQLHDAALSNPKYDGVLGEQFFDLFAAMMDNEIAPVMVDMLAGSERPMMRIIPRWKSIKDIPGTLPFEDVREIIKTQETLALVHCCCKREHRQRQCGTPTQVCISLGRTARYNIDRGAGTQITSEEALRVIDRCDDYPLIHVAPNQTVLNQVFCNCHWCCCGFLRPAFLQNKYAISQAIAKSRFEAIVDPEACLKCGVCLERCQFKANSMKFYPAIGEQRAAINLEKCMGCGACVTSCPSGARKMSLVRPPGHIPEAVSGIY